MIKLSRADFLSKHRDYLLSKEWADIRNDIFQIRGRACERCGCEHSLQVHHLTYDNWMKEEPEDLEILCKLCHEKEHEKPKKRKKAKIRTPKNKKRKKYKGVKLSSKRDGIR